MSSAGLSNTDLLSLLNLCDPAELAALLASQQQPVQPLVSEPLTGLDGLTDGLGASLLNSLGGATAPTAWQLQDAATKDYLLQEMAQSLAVTMEQQRKQQQIATALQLRALQQQQELAALQQLNAAVPPLNAATSNPAQRHLAAFSRAISSDLEYRSTQSLHSQHAAHAAAAGAYQRASSVDLEGLTSPLVPPHMGGVSPLSHHSSHLAPGRSYSSENLEPRRHPLQRGTPLHLGNPPSGRAPPQSRPSFPSSRNPGPRGHRGHGGQRHGATAKAPCWAGSDWHPLKAVLSSASHAAAPSGTGVFLPHLAAENTKAPPERTSSDRLSSHAASSSEGKQASAGTTGSGSDEQRTSTSSDAASGPAGHVHHADTSPACSLDGVSTCSDPWSRSSTMDMDANAVNTHGVAGATGGAGPGPSPLSVDPLKRNPPALREGFDEADEFGPLAKELADLMSRQVMLEN